MFLDLLEKYLFNILYFTLIIQRKANIPSYDGINDTENTFKPSEFIQRNNIIDNEIEKSNKLGIIPQYDGLDSEDSDEEVGYKRRINTRLSTSKELEDNLKGFKVRLIETDIGMYKVKGVIQDENMYTKNITHRYYIKNVEGNRIRLKDVESSKWLDGKELYNECITLKYFIYIYQNTN